MSDRVEVDLAKDSSGLPVDETPCVDKTEVVISLRWLVLRVSGQTVVEMAVVAVTTLVERAGQFVTDAAQLKMVTSDVAYTVDV